MNITNIIPIFLKLMSLLPQLQAIAKDPGSLLRNPALLQDLITSIMQIAGQLFPTLGQQPSPIAASDHIKRVQTALNAKGQTPPLVVDGQYGPMTTAAIKAFQTANGLTVDGWAGPETDAKLGIA